MSNGFERAASTGRTAQAADRPALPLTLGAHERERTQMTRRRHRRPSVSRARSAGGSRRRRSTNVDGQARCNMRAARPDVRNDAR